MHGMISEGLKDVAQPRARTWTWAAGGPNRIGWLWYSYRHLRVRDRGWQAALAERRAVLLLVRGVRSSLAKRKDAAETVWVQYSCI
eukprot:4386792-Prymnesium_polylepis.1